MYFSSTAKQARADKKAAKLQAREEQRERELKNPSSRFVNTQVSYEDLNFTEPPPLNYTLKTRYKSIAIFWTLVFLDIVCMPIILYFCLWYLTSLSHNAVFSISTGALGTVSIVEYFLRFYRLYKKGSTCRVIGARRYYVCHCRISVGSRMFG